MNNNAENLYAKLNDINKRIAETDAELLIASNATIKRHLQNLKKSLEQEKVDTLKKLKIVDEGSIDNTKKDIEDFADRYGICSVLFKTPTAFHMYKNEEWKEYSESPNMMPDDYEITDDDLNYQKTIAKAVFDLIFKSKNIKQIGSADLFDFYKCQGGELKQRPFYYLIKSYIEEERIKNPRQVWLHTLLRFTKTKYGNGWRNVYHNKDAIRTIPGEKGNWGISITKKDNEK